MRLRSICPSLFALTAILFGLALPTPAADFGAVENGYPGVESVPAGVVARAVATVGNAGAEKLFRQMRLLGKGTHLRRVRIMAPVDGLTNLRASSKKVAARATPLQFQFAGFAADQTTAFQNYLTPAYPLMVQVYGDPAPAQQGRVVRIINDANAGDGSYTPPAANATTDGGSIRYDPILPDSSTSAAQAAAANNYNLTRQILIAFHGRQIFAFDAWELGFSDAAALVVSYLQQGKPASFDPAFLGFYTLPLYDLFNRPELGNPFFFSTGTSPNLGFFRAAMAQAAWLKVYLENGRGDFFRNFNAQYYARLASTPGVPLPGNTPTLKAIAGGLVPTVETQGFNDWYRRQYIFDTAVTTGDKLWMALQPLPNEVSGDTRSMVFGAVQYYRTLATGQEQPISGIGTARAVDETGRDVTGLSLEIGRDNRVVFNVFGEAQLNSQNTASGRVPIVGFASTGTPDAARLTLIVTINNAEAAGYFPYNVAGTDARLPGFFGATLGALRGSVSVRVVGAASEVATVARGAFKGNATYPSGERVLTDFILSPTDGAAPRTFRRNLAWALAGGVAISNAVLLETTPGLAGFSVAVTRTASNPWRMISLPLHTNLSDEAAVLGVTPASLLLARYRPNLSPTGFTQDGVSYGITADKHELYPNISEPFAPGRGYWIKLGANLSHVVQGGEPPTGTPYEVPLLGGWNQFGVPYNRVFDVAAVKVRLLNGPAVSLATAINNGLIAPGIWRWQATGGYARVDSGVAADQKLQPFEGYYIFTPQPRGLKLVFDAAITTAALPTQAVAWKLPLAASTATSRDAANAFGVATLMGRTRRAPKPPAATRTVTLGFASSGASADDATQAGGVSGWAESLLPSLSGAATWPFVVDGATSGQMVRLEWGDTAALPGSHDFALYDEELARRVSLRDGAGGYNFIAGSGARRMRIEATPRATPIAGLGVTRLSGSAAVQLQAKFTAPGTADVEIRRSDGTRVVRLAALQSVTAGFTRWVWDGRTTTTTRAVAGPYIARVELRTAAGSFEKEIVFALP